MHFITAADIERHTDFQALVEVLREAFASDIVTPHRHRHDIAHPNEDVDSSLFLMPCWQPGESIGVKIVSVFPNNSKYHLPTIHGTYVLMDGNSGAVKALLDGRALTAKRTAAASALASSFLSKNDSRSLLMIGTGAMAPNLIRAHAAVRHIREVFVWGRDFKKAEQLAAAFQHEKFSVQTVERKEDVMSEVDIISCATLSKEPLVFGRHLRPGQHVDLVGSYKLDMREADDETIWKSNVYLDAFTALDETGDLAIPLRKGILNPGDIQADLAALCKGEKPGRTDDDVITLFKSVGHASEDLAAAAYFFKKINDPESSAD